MMFIQVHILNRRGSNEPPKLAPEVIRVDLIQRMRDIEVTDWDEPCTQLILDGEEQVVCQGTLQDITQAIDELFN